MRTSLCSNQNIYIEGKFLPNLYIRLTTACNAKCPFCNKNTKNTNINLKALENLLIEIKNNNVPLSRVSITGGEPLLFPSLFEETVSLIFSILPSINLTVNTNGYNLDKIKIDEKISGIHISRHHFDDSINNCIFGFDTIKKEEILSLSKNYKKQIRLNCLLIKSYIDSKETITEYLETFNGLYKIGFVSLMPINEYSVLHFVDFKDITFDERFLAISSQSNISRSQIKNCECSNFLFLQKDGKTTQIYMRKTCNLKPEEIAAFVFEGDSLKGSF